MLIPIFGTSLYKVDDSITCFEMPMVQRLTCLLCHSALIYHSIWVSMWVGKLQDML